ncbi:hypothetical protein [Actinomadura mexicana]|uniref:HNH endonuclease n=1 Tax=Actinomadura mexicana TaxID=134959 RepID=A0A239HI76_9ACTN|nr:hypothetical protein [Actinomadura mexicana]SNS81099.1 hypothetical protein SAMN06265355_13146 [Actinomadura mexicana]
MTRQSPRPGAVPTQLTFEDALSELAAKRPQTPAGEVAAADRSREGAERPAGGAASSAEPAARGSSGERAGSSETGQLTLSGVPAGGRERGRGGTVPSEIWRQLLDHTDTRRRYQARVYQREADRCWYWLGAVSDTGHGKLKASRAAGRSIVVTAHVYGWQLTHGPIAARAGEDLVIGHRCDEPSCQNPEHWELIPRARNGEDYRARRHRGTGPLADHRGAHGRAVAIREAIKTARDAGTDVEAAITAAIAAGYAQTPGLF